jgi:hypothetical protein
MKTNPNTSAQYRPWSWHRVWGKSLLQPTPITLSTILAQGNITFRQALSWIIASETIFVLLGSISPRIRRNEIDNIKIYPFMLDIILNILLSIVSVILFCGVVYLIAKIFRRKEPFANIFIAYCAITAPMMIIWSIPIFFWIAFLNYLALTVAAITGLYWVFYSGTLAIKTVYSFSWLGSLFLNIVVEIVIIILSGVLFVAQNPNFRFPF